jgi:hypothetical protein
MRSAEPRAARPAEEANGATGCNIVARLLGMLTVVCVIHACQHHGAVSGTPASQATPSPTPDTREAFYVGEHVNAQIWASGPILKGTIRGTLADDATMRALSGMQEGDIYWIESAKHFEIFAGWGTGPKAGYPWWMVIYYGITKQPIAQPSPQAGDGYWVKSAESWNGICFYEEQHNQRQQRQHATPSPTPQSPLRIGDHVKVYSWRGKLEGTIRGIVKDYDALNALSGVQIGDCYYVERKRHYEIWMGGGNWFNSSGGIEKIETTASAAPIPTPRPHYSPNISQ